MRRRTTACISFLVLLGANACGSTEPPPNLVLVTLDTLRADHLGSYG
jgi:hypothetical protein